MAAQFKKGEIKGRSLKIKGNMWHFAQKIRAQDQLKKENTNGSVTKHVELRHTSLKEKSSDTGMMYLNMQGVPRLL